jgi:hypothetical protein
LNFNTIWQLRKPEANAMTRSFDKPGHANSEETLRIMEEGVRRFGVNQVVVASTYGTTGLAAARLLAGREINLVVVTHNFGFRESGSIEMKPETRRELALLGAKVLSGTMPFRNVGTAIREKQGFSQTDLVANTLRLFGQGIKVCVEIALMAADAGLITPADVVTVAGTGRGADTVALIAPQSSNKLFDLKIREILAKPCSW